MTIAEPEPDVAYAEWRTAVAGVLAKARRVDPAELPAEPERLLDATTYDGLTVAPLYTARDERPQEPLPGEFPFVRGSDATRDVHKGWEVAAEFGGDSDTNTADTNAAILDALANGVSALTLKVSAADLPAVLDGVLLDLAPITLDAGAATAEAADALYGVFDAASVADRAKIVAGLGAAPLTARFAGAESVDLEASVELARAATARAETVRAITVDGTAFHNAGASDAQELGAAAAAGLEYLRALTGAGLRSVPRCARSSSASPPPTTSSRPSPSSAPPARCGRESHRSAVPWTSVTRRSMPLRRPPCSPSATRG